MIGEDPLQPERVWQKMYKGLFLGINVGMNAIEIACWDILGKACGKPVATLLGGRRVESYPLYRAISQAPSASISISSTIAARRTILARSSTL